MPIMTVYKFAEMQHEGIKKVFSSLTLYVETLCILKKLNTK